MSYSVNQIESMLATILNEGLIESEDKTTMPSGIYSRSGVSIMVNMKGRAHIDELVGELRKDKVLRISLSQQEMESEIVDSLVEAAVALDKGRLSLPDVITGLLNRVNQGRKNWRIFLPIIGIDFPEGVELKLVGGVIHTMGEKNTKRLRRNAMYIWDGAKLRTKKSKQKRLRDLTGIFDDIVSSSGVWFRTEVEGRQRAALELALESSTLALDILRFFAPYIGIDPDTSALAIPTEGKRGKLDYLQFEDQKSVVLGGMFGEMHFPYVFDMAKLKKLTEFAQFKVIQDISCKSNPTELESKILLGIQQFGEASRLNSVGAKLQWYLSALETILAKEEVEYRNRSKKTAQRLASLASSEEGKLRVLARMDELYNKRRRLVHYGHRNRVGSDVVNKQDIQSARLYAYLATLIITEKTISPFSNITSHNEFLDALNLKS